MDSQEDLCPTDERSPCAHDSMSNKAKHTASSQAKSWGPRSATFANLHFSVCTDRERGQVQVSHNPFVNTVLCKEVTCTISALTRFHYKKTRYLSAHSAVIHSLTSKMVSSPCCHSNKLAALKRPTSIMRLTLIPTAILATILLSVAVGLQQDAPYDTYMVIFDLIALTSVSLVWHYHPYCLLSGLI